MRTNRFGGVSGRGLGQWMSDGGHWQEVALPYPYGGAYSIAYADGRFVVSLGTHYSTYSDDNGQTWSTPITIPTTYGTRYGAFLAAGNSTFNVWNDYNGYDVATSTDGAASWSLNVVNPSGTFKTVDGCIFYGNGNFVIAGDDLNTTTTRKLAVSTDNGSTWTQYADPRPYTHTYDGTYGDGAWVAVGGGGATSTAGIRSTDGTTWSTMTMPSPTEGGYQRIWSGVDYGGGVMAAVSSLATLNTYSRATSTAAYSTDGGDNWTSMTMPASDFWRRIRYGDGVWLATTSGGWNGSVTQYFGTTAVSYDGTTWIETEKPPNIVADMAYGNGVFVAVYNNSSPTAMIYTP